jgi:hypothetical protein
MDYVYLIFIGCKILSWSSFLVVCINLWILFWIWQFRFRSLLLPLKSLPSLYWPPHWWQGGLLVCWLRFSCCCLWNWDKIIYPALISWRVLKLTADERKIRTNAWKGFWMMKIIFLLTVCINGIRYIFICTSVHNDKKEKSCSNIYILLL